MTNDLNSRPKQFEHFLTMLGKYSYSIHPRFGATSLPDFRTQFDHISWSIKIAPGGLMVRRLQDIFHTEVRNENK